MGVVEDVVSTADATVVEVVSSTNGSSAKATSWLASSMETQVARTIEIRNRIK
jgi:hypothetical protein